LALGIHRRIGRLQLGLEPALFGRQMTDIETTGLHRLAQSLLAQS